MRMFLYYFVRSTWNQLRTFVFTWAFFLFSALFVAGWALWHGFLWYYRHLAETNSDLPEDFMELFQASGVSNLHLIELVVGLLLLGLFLIQALAAEKSVSSLFKQADVNLLFASDLSPQTVLAFRVTNTLALPIFATLLLAIRLPALARHYAMGPYGALAVLLACCLTLAFSVLLKILIYEIGSRHRFFHRNLRWILFALLGLVGYVFYQRYQHSEERNLFMTADGFFNTAQSRWIPIWGWIKGVVFYALEGNMALSLLQLGLSVALICLLAYISQRIPADYYEETLAQTQEAAMLNEEANSDSAALLVTHAHQLVVTREGFAHGWGSAVYFFRVLHNRARSARHGILTRTMLTYAFAALAAGLYVRYFLDDPLEYVPVLVLAAMVFFRTIVSPVTEDIRLAAFLMQPESIWSKLFFSLAGGSCNCALDVWLPLMIGQAAAGFSPFRGLLYLPVLVSVDFFASASGSFADVSIPTSIGVSFKQVIQILLLYAGLIFDGVVLTYGINSGHNGAGFVLLTLLSFLFGGMFLGLTGVWLYPCQGRPVPSAQFVPDTNGAKKRLLGVGLAMTALYLSIHIGQIALSQMHGVNSVLAVYGPIYGLGLPVFLLCCAGLGLWSPGAAACKTVRLSRRAFLALIPICLFGMYAGNLLGYLFEGLWSFFIPHSPQSFLRLEASSDYPVLQALLLSLAAPLMEELVFRRFVLQSLLPYGERAALLTSALLFALFHSSIQQLCYSFFLGLVFGYVTVRTGRIRYSIALHMLINTMGAVVLPLLMTMASHVGSGAPLSEIQLRSVLLEPGVLALLFYLAGLLILSLFGAVLFFFGLREHRLSADTISMKTVFSSWSMLLFFSLAILGLLIG